MIWFHSIQSTTRRREIPRTVSRTLMFRWFSGLTSCLMFSSLCSSSLFILPSAFVRSLRCDAVSKFKLRKTREKNLGSFDRMCKQYVTVHLIAKPVSRFVRSDGRRRRARALGAEGFDSFFARRDVRSFGWLID